MLQSPHSNVTEKKEKKMTKDQVLTALSAALEAKFVPAPPSGCGRAYVCISHGADKATLKEIAKACKELRLIFQTKGYGVGNNAIYIGYDNADGRAIGRSKAFAQVLSEHGISAYPDAASD